MSGLADLPAVRGSLRRNVDLAPYSWLRVGGPADVLFMPKDEADLALFLSSIDPELPVTVLGVASNTIIRDGGIEGIVIRLGPGFGTVNVDGVRVTAGAAALDARVAKAAAKNGVAGLEFYAGVPGTIGGALRMNAGCYGTETKDVLVEAVAIDRRGRRCILRVDEFGYSYRKSELSTDLIFTQATFQGQADDPDAIKACMDVITDKREASQPIRSKTGGSTFKNPDGHSAWKVIDAAGLRGFRVGGAQMSEQHCNFMINADNASAADLEALGETVRSRVLDSQDIQLEWEVRRIGRPA
ncbi:UDP-N-acetylmuramate dehydrogenase [Algimonas porphyrae]|uniref:UDP-N-acetylenolpyruvoylglucosamine reductase n=1 Tax=Algimonas porphyrae TaxID=1128113 RepID=A0ABQ5UXP3_9PROT|nr:UDP-N-acetylmuramate dehydrogenase [Algimonas porphyrae]GLQ20070.1 UDP-N-acetylenolpyruvoylglucosamine reductase [Algimonas porphyrae]